MVTKNILNNSINIFPNILHITNLLQFDCKSLRTDHDLCDNDTNDLNIVQILRK